MSYGIPEETIERVRSQADIVQVVSEYVSLKKAGTRYKACCPFHKEKTPSFMVDPAKQLYHCFGCGAGGNVFGFLMRHEGLTFGEAVRRLAEQMGIQLKQTQYAPEEHEVRERLFDLCEFATSFFSRCLLKSEQAESARKYLEGRRLSGEAINQFSLGYALNGWDSLVVEASKKGFSKELLLQGGLARKSAEGRVYDAFRNRVMFPIWALSGKVVAFGGRTLEEDQPKYINSPETAIYQKGQTLYNLHRAKNSISNNGAVIVVEGYTDLIRVVLSGIDNCVASSGTAFTEAQARLIKRYANEVVLVFDSDLAGKAASDRGIEMLLGQDIAVKAAILPSGKDPDEFILKEGPEALRKTLSEAMYFIEYYADKTLAGWKESGPEERIRKIKQFGALLAKVSDPVRKAEYLRLATSRVDVRPEILLDASQKSVSTDKIEEEVKHSEKLLKHEEREYVWLLKLMIQRPECIAQVREHLEKKPIKNEALRELFDVIFKLPEGRIDESTLLDRVHNEEAQRIFSTIMFDRAGPESLYAVEWRIGVDNARQKRERFSALSREIAEAERAGDAALVEQLSRRKIEVSRDAEELRKEIARIPVDSSAESTLGR